MLLRDDFGCATLAAMKYLTITEYARSVGITRQAVQDRIRRGTLPTVMRSVKRKMIPVDDTVLADVKLNALARDKAGA